ncbi:hypothetical protein PUN28_013811 [Cardiocondyla obscurior]|uniref:Uncharacterized protein n=1 Tax=Cardiocondyla obscurior TaxID=286306 RepID=A0AAW2F6G3_9HYME
MQKLLIFHYLFLYFAVLCRVTHLLNRFIKTFYLTLLYRKNYIFFKMDFCSIIFLCYVYFLYFRKFN